RFVVLVGADDLSDMEESIVLDLAAAGPEAGGLEGEFRAGGADEVVVRGQFPVLPDRVGDGRVDVVLLFRGEDADLRAVGVDGEGRGGFDAIEGGLPGEEGAAVAELAGALAGAVQGVVPVEEECPGGG